MSEKLFRDESMKRFNSPDNLNEYIRVATPGMWTALVAIMIFLVGGIIFSIFARLDTKVSTVMEVKGGKGVCYLTEQMGQYINDDMYVTVEGKSYGLGKHLGGMKKLDANDSSDINVLHMMGKDETGWYYLYEIDKTELSDGSYEGVIILDSVHPINFLTNRK